MLRYEISTKIQQQKINNSNFYIFKALLKILQKLALPQASLNPQF